MLSLSWGPLLGLLTLAPSLFAQQSDHNFLILFADDMGVDLVEAYGEGQDPPSTPTLNLIAKFGLLFQKPWAYSRCSPSRATLQSGRYGFHTGIGGNVINMPGFYALPLEETLLPELLNDTHATACFGKWHLHNDSVGGIDAPNLAGYEHYSGVPALIREEDEYFTFEKVTNGVTTLVEEYITTHTVDEAIQWIGGQSEPWLCTINFNVPHAPIHSPPDHLHSYPVPLEDDWTKYRAAVEALDTELFRLILGILPDLANTTIIFVADNGTEPAVAPPPLSQDNGKGTLYEGGIRVPMLVWSPLLVAPGREVVEPVCITDVWATVADLAGVDTTGIPTDSISFLPHIDGTYFLGAPVREIAFTERFSPNGLPASLDAHRAVRNIRFKLIRRPSGAEEFYNLLSDPFEENDLLGPGAPPLPPAIQDQYDLLSAELDAILAS